MRLSFCVRLFLLLLCRCDAVDEYTTHGIESENKLKYTSSISAINDDLPLKMIHTLQKGCCGLSNKLHRWWSSCSVALKSVKYFCIFITTRSTLFRSGSTW